MAATAHTHPARAGWSRRPMIAATGMVPMRLAGMMLRKTSRAVRW